MWDEQPEREAEECGEAADDEDAGGERVGEGAAGGGGEGGRAGARAAEGGGGEAGQSHQVRQGAGARGGQGRHGAGGQQRQAGGEVQGGRGCKWLSCWRVKGEIKFHGNSKNISSKNETKIWLLIFILLVLRYATRDMRVWTKLSYWIFYKTTTKYIYLESAWQDLQNGVKI